MARFLGLLALALLTVAEVAAVIALQERLGTVAALLVLGLDVLLGLAVVSWGMGSQPPQRGWRIGAGLVIALPGLVLDGVGALMLITPVQRWVSTHVSRGAESFLRRQGMTLVTVTDAGGTTRTTVVPGDVIAGEVVDPATPTDRSPAACRRPGPRVVRGEIAGTEED